MFTYSIEDEYPQKNPLVMVADDNIHIQRGLAQIIEAYGFSTVRASDGIELIEIARLKTPGISVVDYLMPHGDSGIEYKRLYPETFLIIMFSIGEGPLDHAEYLLPKPGDEAGLMAAICAATLFSQHVAAARQYNQQVSYFERQRILPIIKPATETQSDENRAIHAYIREQLNSEHKHIWSSAQFILDHLLK